MTPFDLHLNVLVDSFGQLVEIDGHLLSFDVGFRLESHGHGKALLPRRRVCFFRDFASPELKGRILVFLQEVVTLSLGEFLIELKSVPVLLELDKIVGENLVFKERRWRVGFPLQVGIRFVNPIDQVDGTRQNGSFQVGYFQLVSPVCNLVCIVLFAYF